VPIYEYRCERCNLRAEETRLLARRDDPASCPECGGAAARIPSAAGTVIPLDRAGAGFKATEHPDVDRVVGTDAAHRWEALTDRQRQQAAVVHGGATHVARANRPDRSVAYAPVAGTRAVEHAQMEERYGKKAPPAPLPEAPDGSVG